MTPRIILTISQAREHQRQLEQAQQWDWIIDVQIPILPDKKHDDTRLHAAVRLLDMGCEEQQIAEQLNWQAVPMRMLTRLVALRDKLTPGLS